MVNPVVNNSNAGYSLTEVLMASFLGILVVSGGFYLVVEGTKESKRSLASFNEVSEIQAFSKAIDKIIQNQTSPTVFSSSADGELGRPAFFPIPVSGACAQIHTQGGNIDSSCGQEKVALLVANPQAISVTGICFAYGKDILEPGTSQDDSSKNSNFKADTQYLIVDLSQSTYGQATFIANSSGASNPKFRVDLSSLKSVGDQIPGTPTGGSDKGNGTGSSSTPTSSVGSFGELPLNDLLVVTSKPINYAFQLNFDEKSANKILTPDDFGDRTESSAFKAGLPQRCFNNLKDIPGTTNKNASQLYGIPVKALEFPSLMAPSGTASAPLNFAETIPFNSPLKVSHLKIHTIGFVAESSATPATNLVTSECHFQNTHRVRCPTSNSNLKVDNVSDFRFQFYFDSPLGNLTNTFKYELQPLNSTAALSQTCQAPRCLRLNIPPPNQIRIFFNNLETTTNLIPTGFSLLKNRVMSRYDIVLVVNDPNTNTSKEMVIYGRSNR